LINLSIIFIFTALTFSVIRAQQLALKLKRRIEIRMRQGLCWGVKGHEEPCAGQNPNLIGLEFESCAAYLHLHTQEVQWR